MDPPPDLPQGECCRRPFEQQLIFSVSVDLVMTLASPSQSPLCPWMLAITYPGVPAKVVRRNDRLESMFLHAVPVRLNVSKAPTLEPLQVVPVRLSRPASSSHILVMLIMTCERGGVCPWCVPVVSGILGARPLAAAHRKGRRRTVYGIVYGIIMTSKASTCKASHPRTG